MQQSAIGPDDLAELLTELENMKKRGLSEHQIQEERKILSELMVLRAHLRNKK